VLHDAFGFGKAAITDSQKDQCGESVGSLGFLRNGINFGRDGGGDHINIHSAK